MLDDGSWEGGGVGPSSELHFRNDITADMQEGQDRDYGG
jgi:hypothetical protein